MIIACHLRILPAFYILGYQQVTTQTERTQQMTELKILSAAVKAFEQNFTAICRNRDLVVDRVDEKTFSELTAVLMDALQAAGGAGLEAFLKEHDVATPTRTLNNRTYRYKGTGAKEILTLFGTMTIKRAKYYDEKSGGEYYFPLDQALGLEKDDFATLDAREMILFASSACTPSELAQLLKKCSLCRPSRTAVQNIINRDGASMESMRDDLARTVHDNHDAPKETKALVASLDGVNVLLRQEGMKKGRKNKRPTDTPEHTGKTSYHNAMVGSVSYYGVDDENRHQRLNSIYTARMPQEKSTDFKSDFERMVRIAESKVATLGRANIPHVLLTDGHLMIKGFAAESTVLRPYEKLLDFFHATEHLSKAAEAMYGEKTEFSKAYFNKWRERLKTDPDAPEGILRSLKSFQLRNTPPTKRKADLITEITFFRKNRKLMRYYEFLNRGLPIGSGPIEAAAKTIVRQRMCRSGMSWSCEKGQYVVTIRSYVLSGLWDEAWRQYKKLRNVA
jgi:hypothetical protein